MTRTGREMWGAGQYQAWCAQGRSIDEQRERLAQVPKNMYEQVRSHLNTIHGLKKAAELKKRRER